MPIQALPEGAGVVPDPSTVRPDALRSLARPCLQQSWRRHSPTFRLERLSAMDPPNHWSVRCGVFLDFQLLPSRPRADTSDFPRSPIDLSVHRSLELDDDLHRFDSRQNVLNKSGTMLKLRGLVKVESHS